MNACAKRVRGNGFSNQNPAVAFFAVIRIVSGCRKTGTAAFGFTTMGKDFSTFAPTVRHGSWRWRRTFPANASTASLKTAREICGVVSIVADWFGYAKNALYLSFRTMERHPKAVKMAVAARAALP